MSPRPLIQLYVLLMFLPGSLFAEPLSGVTAFKSKASDCDLIVEDVRELCAEIEDDYQSEVADNLDEIRNSKQLTSVSVAARRLRKVRLGEASAARDFARECKTELDSVPTVCRNHADYQALTDQIKEAKENAVELDVEANKLQKIASSISKSPELKALNQLLPSLLDMLAESPSPITKAGVKPNIPRLPATDK